MAEQLDRNLNIVVLMGGWSSERPVSLMSGNGVADALEERGFTNVTRVDMDRNVAAGAGGNPTRTSCSTRCTERRARTGRSRACST